MTPEELAALVLKRSADVPPAEQKAVKHAYSGTLRKAAEEADDNTITVVASTCGTADDRGGDVIFPGAFKSSIAGFLLDGFVTRGHAWDDLPVAMPTSCTEEKGALVCTAAFHSTQEAQDARTVCKERMDAGKSVSVSVGFLPDYSDEDGVVWFEKGADLLAWAKGKGYDLKDFDQPAIKKLRYCRAITAIAELIEFSLCGVGMNRNAKAVAVKSAGDPPAGKTFDEQFDEALGSLKSLADRWNGIADVRKSLGDTHRAKLTSLLDALSPIAAKSETAPEPNEPDPTPTPDIAETKSRQRDLLMSVAIALAA